MNNIAPKQPAAEINAEHQALTAPVKRKLEACAVAIDKARAKGVALIFEVGRQLQVAHDALANHGDGVFGKWCKERCGMSDRTARNYMGVVEAFGSQKQLDPERLSESFTAESLYYLSRDTTPEEAIKDALKEAKKGQRITLTREGTGRELHGQRRAGIRHWRIY